MFVRIGCQNLGRHKPRPKNRRNDVRRLQRWRSPKSVRPWTTQLKYMLQKRSFNFLPSVPATGLPSPNEPRQSLVVGRRLRRWRNLLSGLLDPVNPRNLWLPVSLWWVGPAPMGRNATHHQVGIAREDRTGPTDARTPPDTMLLDMTVDDERVSGPDLRPRAVPAPGDKRIRLVVQGPAVFPRRRTPVLRPLPLMLIIIASHQVIAGPCHHRHQGRRPTASLRLVIIMREEERVLKGLVHHTSPDSKYSCPRPLRSHQRREP